MMEVKQGSKTLLDLFQASSAKKCRHKKKRLDSPTPMPSTIDPSYATSSSKIAESHYLCNDKKIVGQLSHIKMTSQTKKIEKMKFNPQWLEKYSLVTV